MKVMEQNLNDQETSSSSSASSSSSDESFDELWHTSSGSSAGASDIFGFSSEDENATQNNSIRQDRVCIKNYCEEIVPEYSDRKFIRQFRLERDTVNELIIKYSESEHCVVLSCKCHL